MRRALVLVALLSGCVTPADPAAPTSAPAVSAVSLPLGLEILHEVVGIPSFDGVVLEADIWRPATDQPVPVVAVLSPYMGNELTGYRKDPENGNYPTIYGPYRFLVDVLAPAGYAIALVDLRGTRNSDGCIDLGGPAEQRDAYEMVEFLGTQPWSNGKVGMLGKSYDGLTAQEALAMGAPHLAAIVVEAPVASWYETVGVDGVKYTGWTNTPVLYNAIDAAYAPRGGEEDARWLRSFAASSCAATNFASSNDMTGDNNAWMQERDLRPRAGETSAAVFYVHGLYDINARPNHAIPWYADLSAPKKGYFFQAPHEWPTYEYDADVEEWSGRSDFWRTVHRFFDHWLKGLDNGMADEMNVQIQDNLGRWRNATTYPPPGTSDRVLYLGADGLVDAPGEGSATWRDLLGPAHLALAVAPLDTPDLSYEGTRAYFSSGALGKDLVTSGVPNATLKVSADKPAGHVLALLFDVDENGTAALVNRGAVNLRHRMGVDDPQPYSPGEEVLVAVRMMPQEYVFAAGHEILLVLAASDPWVIPSGSAATYTATFGAETALHLPVLDGEAAYWLTSWGENQPHNLGEVTGSTSP